MNLESIIYYKRALKTLQDNRIVLNFIDSYSDAYIFPNPLNYWVHQKVHLCFTVSWYKNPNELLANPIDCCCFQLISHVHTFAISWTAAGQDSLSFTLSQSLSSSPLCWWCHPTISFSVSPFLLTSVFPRIKVFADESALCIRWPKYWSFSFNITPSYEHWGLISFRIDWFHLLAVQGILRSLLQHPIQKHQFFGHQPSLWLNFHIHTRLLEKS